ncbi:MAG: hypothetical protein WBA61_02605 [Aequorivita sp.]
MSINIRIMETLNLRQHVLDYVKNADNRFIKLVNALAETYEEDVRETIEQYNAEIDAGIDEIERGDFYTQAEMEKMSKKW